MKPKIKKNTEKVAPQIKPPEKLKTLDEICGIVDNKYKQRNINDYILFLKGMTKTDMYLHAKEVGVPYHEEDRNFNIEILSNEFRKYQFSRRVYPAQDLNVAK